MSHSRVPFVHVAAGNIAVQSREDRPTSKVSLAKPDIDLRNIMPSSSAAAVYQIDVFASDAPISFTRSMSTVSFSKNFAYFFILTRQSSRLKFKNLRCMHNAYRISLKRSLTFMQDILEFLEDRNGFHGFIASVDVMLSFSKSYMTRDSIFPQAGVYLWPRDICCSWNLASIRRTKVVSRVSQMNLEPISREQSSGQLRVVDACRAHVAVCWLNRDKGRYSREPRHSNEYYTKPPVTL